MTEETKKTEKTEKCSSCGILLGGTVYTFFDCPNCGQVPLARCLNCKTLSIKYECPECGFVGP